MAVEVNTSGLRKPIGEQYPSLEILQQAVEAGLPLTLGSDAHSPEHVGHSLDHALELVSSLPGAQLARFSQRTMTLVPATAPHHLDSPPEA
jgi:histidinol-phosphatase (PHP family)